MGLHAGKKKTHKFVKIGKTSGNTLEGLFWYGEIMSLQLKDVSDTFAKRCFFIKKKTKPFWATEASSKDLATTKYSQGIYFSKEFIGEHFTTARALLHAKTAPPPEVRPSFLKSLFEWSW